MKWVVCLDLTNYVEVRNEVGCVPGPDFKKQKCTFEIRTLDLAIETTYLVNSEFFGVFDFDSFLSRDVVDGIAYISFLLDQRHDVPDGDLHRAWQETRHGYKR